MPPSFAASPAPSSPVSSASPARSFSLRVLKARARQLQRTLGITHCAALDLVARTQGFASWSLLAARSSASQQQVFPWDASQLFQRLHAGESLLLGSRPGQGKTARAVALISRALRRGLPCWFFSLANDPTDLAPLFARCGQPHPCPDSAFTFVHSDALCAASIIEHIGTRAAPRSLIAIDYLQLLDQRRSAPELEQQVQALSAFARQTGCILLFLSQLRSELDASARAPLPADVRLPNPLDLKVFDRLLLLHDGRERRHRAG